jgi:hypothetical protein
MEKKTLNINGVPLVVHALNRTGYHLYCQRVSSLQLSCQLANQLLGENDVASVSVTEQTEKLIYKMTRQGSKPRRAKKLSWRFLGEIVGLIVLVSLFSDEIVERSLTPSHHLIAKIHGPVWPEKREHHS